MSDYTNEIRELKRLLDSARHAVFFGGAGVSTESGIPDFRGSAGLYTAGKTPEYMLSRTCMRHEPEAFFEFYKTKMLYPDARPNGAHTALAELERRGRIKAVVTQNIDSLHQMAGSKRVLELHGSTARCYCDACGAYYPADVLLGGTIVRCEKCGGLIRPDIVLYEEGLDQKVWMEAEREIAAADLLIVGGSSLVVNPAASLVAGFRGAHLSIVNLSETPYDPYAELLIHAPVAAVLQAML